MAVSEITLIHYSLYREVYVEDYIELTTPYSLSREVYVEDYIELTTPILTI